MFPNSLSVMALGEIEELYNIVLVNITCDENKRSPTINVILYVFFMAGVLLTVFGNLFVIISISHFKQLHTPTNFLVLSLATADFLIGLFVMPVSMIRTIEVCWTFGPTVCFCHIFLDSALSTASVFHLLFIAIDRYYAVCHPLLYTTKITAGVSLVFIAISWLWPMLYTFIYLHTQLNIIVNNKNEHCDGLCLSFVDQVWGTLDLLVSFLIPCTVMLSLYAKVFTVSRCRCLACKGLCVPPWICLPRSSLTHHPTGHRVLYCYHSGNISCTKEVRPISVSVILYLLSAVAVMFTFCGNLVVIISISHFKQLHTPTNILILSLAVADFLVGLINMPFMAIQSVETCWYFGDIFCSVYTIVLYLLTETSILNLVIIAIDRYIAVCDPLLYSTKVNVHVALFAKGVMGSDSCTGDCLLVVSKTWGTVDLIFSFVFPTCIMVTLYTNIFVVAKRHIIAIAMQQKVSGAETKINAIKKSERKAAKTLGIVVAVFNLCWLPIYIFSILNQLMNFSVPYVILVGFLWLGYLNSGLNPIIYALFYPWFRRSLKQIVTLKIFIPGSSLINLVTEK
uniref:G-protein coupled receptors family 1 profile domain-containing protein n=1 Tax=Erpetoichthys calabaricus TaxID=27687 RepID=A0A8C4RKB3_ERPCA